MGRYFLRRLIISVPVLLFVTLIAFTLVNLAPGDPVTSMINPVTRAELGPDWVEQRQAALGLDKPVVYRYGIWLKEVVPWQSRVFPARRSIRFESSRRAHRPNPAADDDRRSSWEH